MARVEHQLENLEDRFDSQEDSQSLSNLASQISSLTCPPAPMHSVFARSPRPAPGEPPIHVPDFDGIIRHIRELNLLIGNTQCMEMCFTTGGATFKVC